MLAPGSRFAGRTIQLSGIRARYGISVFGVQRKSRMARMPLSEIRLEPGDTLLLGGNYDQLMHMRGDHDLLLLEYSAEPVPQTRKATIAFTIFLMIIILSAFEILPIVVSAISGRRPDAGLRMSDDLPGGACIRPAGFSAGRLIHRPGDRHAGHRRCGADCPVGPLRR